MARSGHLTAGDFVGPIAAFLSPSSTSDPDALMTKRSAVLIQLGPLVDQVDDRPLARASYGTDLTQPPEPGSEDEATLRRAVAGDWHLAPGRVAGAGIVIAARQGRTLAVYRIVDEPHRWENRYWFSLDPVNPDDPLHHEFVGENGRTFPSSRNPVRYWPPR